MFNPLDVDKDFEIIFESIGNKVKHFKVYDDFKIKIKV